jgi:hypothetical protein
VGAIVVRWSVARHALILGDINRLRKHFCLAAFALITEPSASYRPQIIAKLLILATPALARSIVDSRQNHAPMTYYYQGKNTCLPNQETTTET